MIDTPFETWCAELAYLLTRLGTGENAVDYVKRYYDVDDMFSAFRSKITPKEYFDKTARKSRFCGVCGIFDKYHDNEHTFTPYVADVMIGDW